ncbi:MAG: hypothetical protein NTY02_00180 [Acidobacteria bacterium]|nr:hypothetical protein [Acidobacteriota bacterium]
MRVLNTQRDFACRHSGECCTFGWHVPIDRRTMEALSAALASGRLRVPGDVAAHGLDAVLEEADPPEGAVAIVRNGPDGHCVFLDPGAGNMCAIQHQLGHTALPPACQQFPRVTLIDSRGAHIAMSHYCPTVARQLLRADLDALAIVEMPQAWMAGRGIQGFDARATVPPYLRPGVVFDEPSYDFWERQIVSWFGRPGSQPDHVLAALAAAADDLRTWTPDRGTLKAETQRICAAFNPHDQARTWRLDPAADARLFDDVAASVPPELVRPARPSDAQAADDLFVAPVWPDLSLPIGRYLAAKAFASHTAYLGEGVRTQVMAIAAARAVLRVETARQAAARPCDEALFVAAVRRADALIEHLSDKRTLVRRWAHIEHQPSASFFAAVGLVEAA